VGELGQDFVHDADLGSEAVRVDVFCEEAANVACWKEFKCQWRSSHQAAPCVLRRGRKTALGGATNCIPRPPTMSTEGFSGAPVEGGGTASPMIAECCPAFGREQQSREEMNKERNEKLPFRARPARDGGVIPSRICAPYKGRLMRQGGLWGYHRQGENNITTTLKNSMEKTVNIVAEEM